MIEASRLPKIMDIEFHATIKILPESELILSEPLNYSSRSGVKVEMSNHDKDEDVFVAKMKIAHDNIDEAREICELELINLSNFLSWKHYLKILGSRINGYEYSEKTDSMNAVVIAETLHMNDSVSIKKIIALQGMDGMKKTLEEGYDYHSFDVLTMWREAIADKSSASKFFQLYRLLECIHDGIRVNVEKWILKKNPNVPMRMSGKNGKGQVSIYTYLRDNVHYKENKFPYKEIKDNVPAFEGLVKEAILEKYPELSN